MTNKDDPVLLILRHYDYCPACSDAPYPGPCSCGCEEAIESYRALLQRLEGLKTINFEQEKRIDSLELRVSGLNWFQYSICGLVGQDKYIPDPAIKRVEKLVETIKTLNAEVNNLLAIIASVNHTTENALRARRKD